MYLPYYLRSISTLICSRKHSRRCTYACAVHVPHLNDFNTDLVEMRKGRSVEDLDRQRMAELETAFEQSAEEEPEQGMEV